MCCLITAILLFGPRLVLLFGWLFSYQPFMAAFNSIHAIISIIWWFFLPWTFFSWVILFPIEGGDSLLIALIAALEVAFLVMSSSQRR